MPAVGRRLDLDLRGESVRLMRAVGDLRLPVEIVVVSDREAAEWGDVRGSLVYAALAEGRVLA